MAWGIARWGEELEFAMSATKEEPHPEWESKVRVEQFTGESLCIIWVRKQPWDWWKVLRRSEVT